MLVTKKMIIVAMLLITSAFASIAQTDKLVAAYKFLQAGQLDSAKAVIEPATQHAQTMNDPQTWYIRGFIYKEIYKTREAKNKLSPARETSFQSFKKSIQIDTSKSNMDGNIPSLRYIAATYFNDAGAAMDTVNYSLAIKSYGSYKEVMTIVEPQNNMMQKDVEFNLALASVYTDIYNADRKNRVKHFELAKTCYNKVLSLEPNNVSANYHMGILYYNQAVDIINQSDYDIDIVMLDKIQDNSIALFKQSLPFMEKAYQLDPNKEETLVGLTGIYFSLHEFEKSAEFKARLEEIKKQK
jgi:tetratricopeptide (TPR) repeat protein